MPQGRPEVFGVCRSRQPQQDLVCRSTPFPGSALYVFAADHPDAQNAAIEIVYDCPPGYKLRASFAVAYAVNSMD